MLESRPESMERITTPELANAFIEDQIAKMKAQIGDKKVLLALSGGVENAFQFNMLAAEELIHQLLQHCLSRL